MIAHQNGAGVDYASLRESYQKKCGQKQSGNPKHRHHCVSKGIAQGQNQNAPSDAKPGACHAADKTGNDTADTHGRQQGSCKCKGKSIPVSQQGNSHSTGDGTQSAEKKGHISGAADRSITSLFHNLFEYPLLLAFSAAFFFLTALFHMVMQRCKILVLAHIQLAVLGVTGIFPGFMICAVSLADQITDQKDKDTEKHIGNWWHMILPL